MHCRSRVPKQPRFCKMGRAKSLLTLMTSGWYAMRRVSRADNPGSLRPRVTVAAGRIVAILLLFYALVSFDTFLRGHGNNTPRPAVVFRNVLKESGIHFIHDNAASSEKYFIETMGAGCAWIDYNNDGWLDAYFVQSAETPLYKPSERLRGALYRNNGDGTFADVTEEVRAGAEGLFGMGAAVGDYDNDGFPDLYVIGWDRSILYRNNGDGTFRDVTAQGGVANPGRWGSSAAFFDYDKDGWLDLVVVNYVVWSPETNLYCGEHRPGYRAYCHPDNHEGQLPTLYRNNGDGTFTDATREAGLASEPGKGLGVVTADFNNDGWPDIFQANDTMRNFLFLNNGNGTFREAAFKSGVALSEDGRAEAGMGTDAADYNGDGWLDIFVTHLNYELNRLYRNNGDGTFDDATYESLLGNQATLYSGFGTRFFDYDNDGLVDLFVANGHILDNISLFNPDVAYAEPNLMFRNTGRGRFENVSQLLGPDFSEHWVSRGAAVGDYDNDGDLDILVSNNGQAPQLLRNEGGNANHWLSVRLRGTKSNRDGIGARLKVVTGGQTQVAEARGGMSYQSAQDPRIHFGLGDRAVVDLLEITWPSGIVDRFTQLEANRFIIVEEGLGRIEAASWRRR